VLGWAAHAAALAAGSDGDPLAALVALETALHCAEAAGDPFELARVLVTSGLCERRLRRKRPARAALERAARLFAGCEAEAWVVRTRAELERASSRRPQGRGLTVTERRACERAAAGRSNSEIGAELYVSRRTVESNLSRAYAKLGIRNRAQLGAALARIDATAAGEAPRPTGDGTRGALRSAFAVLHPALRPAAMTDSPLPAAS
jgi:DNA-binding CsgD family transcriptional regulator